MIPERCGRALEIISHCWFYGWPLFSLSVALEEVVLLVASGRLINVVDNEISRYLIWENPLELTFNYVMQDSPYHLK